LILGNKTKTVGVSKKRHLEKGWITMPQFSLGTTGRLK
jgi:hypothetical protein